MKKIYSLESFLQKNWSFVLVKNDKIIYRSKLQGLKPLIFCIKKHGKEMRGAIVFDKVIGRAAAFLLAYAKIGEIWTPIISKDAKKILARNKIKFLFAKEVSCILNRKGDDLCPMEKLSREKGQKIAEFLLKRPISG